MGTIKRMNLNPLLSAEGWKEVKIERLYKNTPKSSGWFGCFISMPGASTQFAAEGTVLHSSSHTGILEALYGKGTLLVRFGPSKQDSYGTKLVFQDMEPLPSAETVRKQLLCVPGIGASTAEKVLSVFGRYSCFVASRHPELLPRAGISEKRCKQLSLHLCFLDNRDRVRVKVPKDVLPDHILDELCDFLGDEILDMLSTRPYTVLHRLPEDTSVRFSHIDGTALCLNPGLAFSMERVAAAVSDCVRHFLSDNKHTCFFCGHPGADGVPERIFFLCDYFDANYHGFEPISPKVMWSWCRHPDSRCVIMEHPDGSGLCLYTQEGFSAEQEAAASLKRLRGSKVDSGLSVSGIREGIAKYERVLGCSLSAEQRDAVEQCLLSRLSVVTGIPGSGKTTVAGCIMYVFFYLTWKHVTLMAPTGRASKRLADATACSEVPADCGTIDHFLTKITYQKDSGEGAFRDSLLIVDETSMLDIYKASRILPFLEEGHVVFLGDADQLPSIQPGCFFRDLIASGICPVSYLSVNQRSKDFPALSEAAVLIREGCGLSSGKWADIGSGKLGFSFSMEQSRISPGCFHDVLWKWFSIFQNRSRDLKDTIVLSPTNDMMRECNFFLQDQLNPENPSPSFLKTNECKVYEDKGTPIRNCYCYGKKVGTGRLLRVGDRVVFTKNDRDYDLVNGDMGTILFYREYFSGPEWDTLILQLDTGRIVEIVSCDFRYLEPAYGVSVHKAQGCEYKHVIVLYKNMLWDAKGLFAQRNLLYTAVTRAKEACMLIGDADSFDHFIRTPMPERMGLLRERLQDRV